MLCCILDRHYCDVEDIYILYIYTILSSFPFVNPIPLYFFFPVNDTLDDMLNESGDEEESDAIVNQVLDEIGIEIGAKVGVLCLS